MLSKKQLPCQFYLSAITYQFWVKSMLVSLLSSWNRLFFWLIVYRCFTDGLPLISWRNLKFCARIMLHLGPLTFNMLPPPICNLQLDEVQHLKQLTHTQIILLKFVASYTNLHSVTQSRNMNCPILRTPFKYLEILAYCMHNWLSDWLNNGFCFPNHFYT